MISATETNDQNVIDSTNSEHEGVSRKLDEKLMELQSLFEVSQTLNSSLNLKSILDNMLLTPMGKMMITRGIVLLHNEGHTFQIETLKGLPKEFIDTKIEFDYPLSEPVFVEQIESSYSSIDFFAQHKIILLIPIRSSDKTLGFIGFGSKIVSGNFQKTEIEYLKSLSNIAATSIENGLMVRSLQEVNRRLDKKIQELNTIFDISRELNSILDSEKILNLLCFAVMGEMLVNRCLIFAENNGRMRLAVTKGIRDHEIPVDFSAEVYLNELATIADPVLLNGETESNSTLHVLRKAEIRVVVPMRIKRKTQGILAIGDRINKAAFQDYDLEFLFTLGNEAMIYLENARLFEEALEKKRLEEELAIAREIQQKMLPKTCPSFSEFEIAAINVPSLQVSGDYFDCIELNAHKVCLAIADVSGKGTGASLLMANLQAVLHALIDADASLVDVVSKINNLIYRNTNYDKFITFFFGILDVGEKSFTYVNAGHNPPMLMRSDGSLKALETGGLILGMMPNMPYLQEKIALQPGNWIVMFTDGVTEAVNIHDEEFGERRLEDLMRLHRNESAEEMKNAILSEVRRFSEGKPQADDITLLNLKVL
ncbi:MAG: GAF domain-containing SpoIIE family protein phosphatase [Candidatus Zhuqueibacterota bacterium]